MAPPVPTTHPANVAGESLFDLDLRITSSAPPAAGTGLVWNSGEGCDSEDGCGTTCASACAGSCTDLAGDDV